MGDARILVSSMPFAGHVGAMAAVSNELVKRGHHAIAHTGAKYRHKFESAEWLPWKHAPDFDDAELGKAFPSVKDGKGVRANFANVRDVLVGTGAAQARDVLEAEFDLVVTDHLAFGAAMAAELRQVPWATIAVTPLVASRPLVRVVSGLIADGMFNRMRAEVGLKPKPGALEAFYSPELVIAQGVPELETVHPPHQVRFVGRLISPPPAAVLPGWWADLDNRTVVHVTQGTLETGADDLLKPAIEALAGHDALVVATTGGAAVDTLGTLPDNVRAAEFIPHDLLLPRTDVMITNGGWGGVLAAIEAGVPLVVVPGSLDKPQVARRVARAGAGVTRRKPRGLGTTVDQVLSEPRHRERAEELGRQIRAAGGAARAAELVEELLRRR
ncbi:glycosyltransferase [Lentzea flava]|uniref:Glycosyl transferase n=1 Tax=Lentzea flava TaxID=103732 RepID=A0ABQ2V0L2_9PSEU|nr:nucleotide disphospho-sugar-binding domain-containing protein [Lentzea flava]MCP2202580.1 glycosyltransferase, MGT family [Lentzea flava]GGU60239.1 glycosyl transferase [Lentzea flava]